MANKRTFTRLVDMGIAESGLGDPESRMGKRMKIRGVLRDALRQKSVGIIEEIPEKGIVKYGKPAGIIACIVPTTNPDLTPAGNAIYAIKARDVVIFSPHPRSKKTSYETVTLMRAALEREGAPADILQCLTRVNIPMSQAVMARADLVVATGGQPMVRAAYSSGTPAYGVGAGNSTMIIDETANIEEAARNTRLSKTSDFGSGCSADGNLIIEASYFRPLLAQLQVEGGYLASAEEKALLRKVMWDDEAPSHFQHRGHRPAAARPDRRVFDPGRPQIHHRPRRWHRQGAPVFRREADDAARRLQVRRLRRGARDDARHLRSRRQGPLLRHLLVRPEPHPRAGAGGARVADHGPPAAIEGQRRRLQQRDADDVEPGLRHVGRQHRLGERAPQALPQHDWVSVPIKADQPSDEELFGEFYDPALEAVEGEAMVT